MKELSRGLFWLAALLGIIPMLVSGILLAPIYWASTDGLPPLEAWVIFGLIFGSVPVAWFLRKHIYVVNDKYIVSHFMCPFSKELIALGPGFHFTLPWWQFDSHTEHEDDVNIKTGGTFETFGETTLNLVVKGISLVLTLPIELSPNLRHVAKGMKKIKEELKDQLEPALKQAVGVVFARHPPSSDFLEKPDLPKDRKTILGNPLDIVGEIIDELEKAMGLEKNYGVRVKSLSLGDINFTDPVNTAREERFQTRCNLEAAEAYKDRLKISGDHALENVLQGNKGVTMVIRRHHLSLDGLTEEAAGALGKGLSAFVASKQETKKKL